MANHDALARVLLLGMPGAPWRQTLAVRSLTAMFTNDHRLDVVAVDALAPLPPRLAQLNFDIIILSPTFLSARYSHDLLDRIKTSFSYVATSTAMKVALPQDDYDCSEILESWLADWGVDLVYTVCPDNWGILYPRCHAAGKVRLGYTAYLLDGQVLPLDSQPSWTRRHIDVTYRASRLPFNFGGLGQLKAEVVDAFLGCISSPDRFVFDLAVGHTNQITGRAWMKFMADSRFVLVSPSGSPVIDPVGELRRLAIHDSVPQHSLEDFFVAAKGLKWSMCENTMISPRNIEAALTGTVQIALPSSYSGILDPHDHYVPLDGSRDVEAALANDVNWHAIRHRTFEAITSVHRLRASAIIGEILDEASIHHRRAIGQVRTQRTRRAVVNACTRAAAGFSATAYWGIRQLRSRAERKLGPVCRYFVNVLRLRTR